MLPDALQLIYLGTYTEFSTELPWLACPSIVRVSDGLVEDRPFTQLLRQEKGLELGPYTFGSQKVIKLDQ